MPRKTKAKAEANPGTALAQTTPKPLARRELHELLAPPPVTDSRWSEIAAYIAEKARTERRQDSGPASLLERPTLIAGFLQAIANGLPPTAAARMCAFAPSVISDWHNQADIMPESYMGLASQAIRTAIEHSRAGLIDGIKAAGASPQHWTALAWVAERSPQFSGDYKLNADNNMAGPRVVVNIGIKASDVSVEVGEGPVVPGEVIVER